MCIWCWLEDHLPDFSNIDRFENPNYGNKDRTEEFLKGFKK